MTSERGTDAEKQKGHTITVDSEARAICCDQHTTYTAECTCGWTFNENRINEGNRDRSNCSSAIQAHKIEVLLGALGIEFKVEYKERVDSAWAR